MGINFAAASTAGLNNPGTEIITLVKDESGNFVNPPSYDKMLAYLRSGDVPCLFVTDDAGTTGDIYQLSGYSETENKIRFTGEKTAIEFSAGSDVPVETEIGGGGAAITDGIVVKARDSEGYATEVDFYGTQFYSRVFCNLNANAGYWIKLLKINCKTDVTAIGESAFYFCPVVDVDLTKITSMKTGLQNAKGITNLDMPLLTTLQGNSNFNAMSALETVNLPKISKLTGNYNFADDTALRSVTIGSIGFGLTEAPSNNTFQRCTQTGLTITVYTTGAYADTALTNIRNGATKATITIKASEDTQYSGTAYTAGETIVTSEVA